jgi:hypothetical protein
VTAFFSKPSKLTERLQHQPDAENADMHPASTGLVNQFNREADLLQHRRLHLRCENNRSLSWRLLSTLTEPNKSGAPPPTTEWILSQCIDPALNGDFAAFCSGSSNGKGDSPAPQLAFVLQRSLAPCSP